MIGGAKGIGLGIDLGLVNQYNRTGYQSYIEPEVLDSLVGVWSAYGMTNDSPNRSIIKNKLSNKGGDFVISNAAYEGMSGYNGYPVVFGANKTWANESNGYVTSITSNTIHIANVLNAGLALLYSYVKYNGNLQNIKEIPPFKIEIKGLEGRSKFIYKYLATSDATKETNLYLGNGTHELPKSFLPTEALINDAVVGFSISPIEEGVTNFLSDITIEVLPEYEGAFVTDGIDDLITSTKTVQEMLGGSNEITVVSMIHQIGLISSQSYARNNYFIQGNDFLTNTISAIGKIGIYGYKGNLSNIAIVNDILGDKKDYSVDKANPANIDSVFSVNGTHSSAQLSSVAWYWTIIANKVLTSDQINQVIAYFNLDRTLNPDILCNITKQGITNDNHADFNDKLIDYSGNGRDIQMNNLAWKGGSGIAAKPFETIKDYTILSDEARQELTIYNEFSYKVKSNTPNHYWVVQSIIKDNTSYQVTIITDKDCYWINSTSFTNNKGNKESIRKEYPVKANTPTQVIICGLNEFEYPEGIEPTTAVSYVNLEYAGEITVTFIPSHKGGLLLDGVNDFGKVTGMPVYKDYTFIIDRQIISIGDTAGVVASKSEYSADATKHGAFIFEYLAAPDKISTWSFYKDNGQVANTDFTRGISYQSTYSYNGKDLTIGTSKDSDKLWLGTIRDNDSRFFNGAIYSLMSFPYSMSEFLIERQLKKHKLGTLYPDMVEFRPIVKSNSEYQVVYYYIDTFPAVVGNYYPINSKLRIAVTTKGEADEVTSLTVNGVSLGTPSVNGNRFTFNGTLSDKSPQKINITIDEYIRFEDIVQPYPLFFEFTDENGNLISWGGKAKVGNTITRTKSVSNANILAGLYNTNSYKLNGKPLEGNSYVVEKQMVFTCTATWDFDNNEPKCILSPRLLRIPNSSYKILGHIPDISGHGNHGVIHNSAYVEGSGANEDGSYQLDGVDDHITIPTLSSGGKQVLMKVNLPRLNNIIYDQRKETNTYTFAILTTPSGIAYDQRNSERITYIDGILNTNIIAEQLMGVTHNIVVINSKANLDNTRSPILGSDINGNNWSRMRIYDFMIFDKISTDDKIKELNEYMGIEAKVELPPYYWDTYGKTNSDADRDTIQQRGIAVGDYDLTNTNFAYDKMSGFGGYTLGKFTNSWSLINNSNSISIVARNPYDITLKKLGENIDWGFNNTELKIISNPVSVKFKSDKNIRFKCDYHYYTVGGNSEGAPLGITSKDLIANEDTIITISPISQENIDKYNIDINRGYYLIYFQLSPTLAVNEEVTIEMLPLYPNGLVYDGITDYSENANIPALTDFTVIAKRVWMNKDNHMNECFIHKGVVSTPISESALMLEYEISNDTYYRSSSYGGYINIKRSNRPERIVYQTSNSYNGTSITKGSGTDTTGIVIGGVTNNYWNGVFYKLILYPKTIPLLQINFLKNLMERDEIIDLNNKIFIQE